MKVFIVAVLCLLSASLTLGKDAEACAQDSCEISDNCRCSTVQSPLADGEAPQLIVLTFDDPIVDSYYEDFWSPLLLDRNNPDGNPITGTFYVPHEFTNYQLVQQLYVYGFEIGVNSISKNNLQVYWRNATLQTLENEFGGQREIISHFANIPLEDIRGARTPQFQLEGDVSIEAYIGSGLLYDNSWPTYTNLSLYPYTLDYRSTQRCTLGNECPVESHPGFWVAPITNLRGAEGRECNSLYNCLIEGSPDEIANWLLGEVDRVKTTTKAPITILLSDLWFKADDNNFAGFEKFLDGLEKQKDVFLVSEIEVINWMKNPVPVDSFRTATFDRELDCAPTKCTLTSVEGFSRVFQSCAKCPDYYPWLGSPLGDRASTAETRLPTVTPPPNF